MSFSKPKRLSCSAILISMTMSSFCLANFDYTTCFIGFTRLTIEETFWFLLRPPAVFSRLDDSSDTLIQELASELLMSLLVGTDSSEEDITSLEEYRIAVSFSWGHSRGSLLLPNFLPLTRLHFQVLGNLSTEIFAP